MKFLYLFLLAISGACTSTDLKGENELLEKNIDEILSQKSKTLIDFEQLKVAKIKLWEKYKKEEQANLLRIKEIKDKKMSFNGVTMRYDYSMTGAKPGSGRSLYIALHGGGSVPVGLNDSQWEHMKVYYKESIKEGIYVATRGVSNSWDLHFRPESYVLYDRLIENMILFEEVNPDKVYIMGFSAGGDGVYRIATSLADRWAAASMSAGHAGHVKAKNLYQGSFSATGGRKKMFPASVIGLLRSLMAN